MIFERAVARIERILRGSSATVEWNASVQTTAGIRRCDAIVRYDSDGQSMLVLIECRKRKHRSGVQWLDELVGKAKAIHAHRVIAVSNQRLSANALKRAEEEGIEVRTLGEFTSLAEQAVLKLCGASFASIDVGLPILNHEHIEVLYAPPRPQPFPYVSANQRSAPVICDILTDGATDVQDVLDALLTQRGPILAPNEQPCLLLTHVRPNGASLSITSEKRSITSRTQNGHHATTLRFSGFRKT